MSLPFIPDEKTLHPAVEYGLPAGGALFFGVLAWWTTWTIGAAPSWSVTIDDDGLWWANSSKERGLVPWASIVTVRERLYRERLDLVDERG